MLPARFQQKRPFILAHRGANQIAPENTLSAFQAALDLKADGIELDVQLTKDRKVVVCHDYTLKRTTGSPGLIREKTYQEISSLDAGSHFSSKYSFERIPLLDRVIKDLPEDTLFNIELKDENLFDKGLEKEVTRIVQEYSLYQRTIISSFNPFSLRRIARLDKNIALGLILSPELPIYLRKAWFAPKSLSSLHPYYTMKELILKQELPLIVWSVNDPSLAKELKPYVRGFITDNPEKLGL